MPTTAVQLATLTTVPSKTMVTPQMMLMSTAYSHGDESLRMRLVIVLIAD